MRLNANGPPHAVVSNTFDQQGTRRENHPPSGRVARNERGGQPAGFNFIDASIETLRFQPSKLSKQRKVSAAQRPSLFTGSGKTMRLIERLADRSDPAAIPTVASGLFSSNNAIHDAASLGLGLAKLLCLVPSLQFTMNQESKFNQVIVMGPDLKMRRGKQIAQGHMPQCHFFAADYSKAT